MGRYRRGPELQPCEFRRDAQADILDAAHRPPARDLGRDAIRFSTRPQLGGWATVVEIGPGGDGRVEGRVFLFYGHWRTSWRPQEMRRFTLSASDFRRLAGEVDTALTRWQASAPTAYPDGTTAIIVCTDGPGYLTERGACGRRSHLGGPMLAPDRRGPCESRDRTADPDGNMPAPAVEFRPALPSRRRLFGALNV